ncbi:MAG: hypothetical protein Q9183_001944 [Haloplaca sp. 2 TL-2023]
MPGGSSRPSRQRSGSDTQMEEGINVPGSWGQSDVSNYRSQYGTSQVFGQTGHGENVKQSGFFIPSYLRNSRLMERLQAAHDSKTAAQREAASTHPSGKGTLSSRSSNVSLPKLAPSHRGMTYEIIEHQPPETHVGWSPLPTKWAETDKNQCLAIGEDGLEVRFIGGQKLQESEAAATRADHPMPVYGGMYYYEVMIISNGKDGMIGIGFSGPKNSLEKLPGWEPETWGYHGDDGNTFCCGQPPKKYGPKFTTGDVIGCGINFMTGCAFFTKNGIHQGTAFRDLKGVNVHPCLGIGRPNAHVTVNFGQKPFVYDIDDVLRRERAAVREEVNSTPVARLHPESDESSFLKELVAQFLTHHGFIETAKAFTTEVRSESMALQIGKETSQTDFSTDEDLDLSNRQQIRAAIMDGDIDKALKRTNAFYPQVLRDSSHVYFRLRCQKFVEMIRQTAELLQKSPAKTSKSSNGQDAANMDTEMDIDGPKNESEDWDKMETEEGDTSVKYHEMLEESLRYAQVLKQEFKDDASAERDFKEIFSLFMYEDPRKSPQAHLLDRASRLPVAEELNSAILVSLGKSSLAAIELLYQQTEVLVDYLSEEGGAGAFINVRNDFVR